VRRAPPERGEGGQQALAEWGFTQEEIRDLSRLGLGIGE